MPRRTKEGLVAEIYANRQFWRSLVDEVGRDRMDVADPDAFAWTDGDALLDADFTAHLHEEHLPSIRAWLDSRPTS